MRALPTDRRPVSTIVALAVALVVILGACTKSAETASAPSGTVAATTSSNANPGTKPASASPSAPACSAEVLDPILKGKFAGAALADLVCSTDAAVATIAGAGSPAGGGVAFFVVKDGAWVVAADGPAADADSLRPAAFSSVLLASWKDKRSPAAPTTPRPSTPGNPKPGTESCRKEGDNSVCSSTTAPRKTAKTTTTTKAPTTTAPPTVTAPPPTTLPPR